MRSVKLGNAEKATSWSPQFKASRTVARRADKVGRRNTPMMTYYPTVKGEERPEGLRHYFHWGMACILDGRPDVLAWTAATEPLVIEWRGRPLQFTPDFRVAIKEGFYSIRLIRAGTQMSDIAKERHAAVTAAYRRLDEDLEVVTEEALKADPRASAARELYLHSGTPFREELPEAICEVWAKACPTTLGDIHDSMGADPRAWRELLSLASAGYVHVGLEESLGRRTPVVACNNKGYRT